MAFSLTTEQYTAVYDRGDGLLVSAAAGSGKTRVLVERLLSRIEEGKDIDRFLVITYTRAAAAELRGRIVSELSDRQALRPEDAFLRRQSTLVYKAQISTIDAFCTQLLREEGHRLDLDHDFRLCDENESAVLMEDALNEVLDRRYETIAEGSDFAQLVDTMSAGRDDRKLMNIALDIRRRIQSYPDPGRWLERQEELLALEGIADVGETPWGRLLLADARRQADHWAGRMEELQDLTVGDDVLQKAYGPSLQVTQRSLQALSAATGKGWDETVKAAKVEYPKLGNGGKAEDQKAKERIMAVRKDCKKSTDKLEKLFGDASADLLEDMRAVYPALRGLFALVRDFESEYTALKRQRGVLDFSDLEHLAAQLLVGEDGQPTDLARQWGERYDEVMVDEYQDTNAVQNALFSALTDGGKNLFMVGDVKQSIYRFRLADPSIFLKKYRAFLPVPPLKEGEKDAERKGKGPGRVLLSQNFRSRPQVLEGVNYLFRAVMSETFGEMAYGDDEALIPGGTFPNGKGDYALELDLLDTSTADNGVGPKIPRDQLEARFAARRIKQLLKEGFPVSDGEGGTRPVQPEDVVILLRSPRAIRHYYAGALGELDIPWSAEGAGDFFDATEIQVALSILRMVDNPRQDVALIAALRSAVYGFSADRLAQIRTAAGGDFYTALSRDQGEDSAAFLEELRFLRRQAEDRSCEDLLWQIYDRTNLLGIYGALDEGETRRANLLLLAQLARDFEAAGHKGLFGFLAYLRRLEEDGRALLSSGGVGIGGVRLMSIHGSKGLEFPVVILSGLTRGLNKMDMRLPMLFHPELGLGPKRLDMDRMLEYPTVARQAVVRKMEDELAAEELRLLYVAMTRAKEKLILSCALEKGKADLESLLPSVGVPVEPQDLLECESPAQWILLAALARPEALSYRDKDFPPRLAPGTDFGPAWDFRWVDAAPFADPPAPDSEEEAEKEGPEEEEEKRAREQARQEEKERLQKLYAWVYPNREDVEVPSKLTATQLKGRDLDKEAAQETDQPAVQEEDRDDQGEEQKSHAFSRFAFDRPRFVSEKRGLTPTEKGTALHLVMQYIDFDRCGSVEEVAEEIVRLTDGKFITPQQAQAVAPARVRSFFASELGREAMAAEKLRREFKFSILVPATRYFPRAGAEEKILLQGVVDCYFETEKGITVVDFKTDRVKGRALLERAEGYRPQLEAYAQALSEITGKPIARRVLWFFSEGRAVEV